MGHLLLIRHAQAADASPDRERPLTDHGLRAARAIGSWLRESGFAPDRALVSSALRAQQTWAAAARALGDEREPTVEQRIYDNTVEALLEVIAEAADDVGTLVVVGHNPSIGQLAFDLDDGSGSESARRDLPAGFPTGAVAVFGVGGSFADLGTGTATLEDLAVPGA
jgi:phosphohistidine phosphatase